MGVLRRPALPWGSVQWWWLHPLPSAKDEPAQKYKRDKTSSWQQDEKMSLSCFQKTLSHLIESRSRNIGIKSSLCNQHVISQRFLMNDYYSTRHVISLHWSAGPSSVGFRSTNRSLDKQLLRPCLISSDFIISRRAGVHNFFTSWTSLT